MTYACPRYSAGPVIAAALLTLAACSSQADPHAGQAFPMTEFSAMDQPRPTQPLLGDPIVTAQSVLPAAKPDIRTPLPPMVDLPSAKDIHAASSNASGPGNGGAVNPAAGQAAAISDGQGEGSKQVLGAPK